MGNEKRADRGQIYLLPPSLDDWVGPDAPVRFISAFVEGLDLDALGFCRRKSEVGSPSYSREMLLGIWIYGFFEKITSSRSLEKACKQHIGLIWLTGQHYPDHNTLWRFWHKNKDALKGVFGQTVLVADKMKLIGMVLQAVDGTKIEAVASKATSWKYKSMSEKLVRIEQSIQEMENAVDGGDGPDGPDGMLPEELDSRKKLAQAISQALESMDELKTKSLNPHEPDARAMTGKGRGKMCYNAQAVVDQKQGLIVAQALTNQANDMHQLHPMVKAADDLLPQGDPLTLADAGYDTIEQLHLVENDGFSVLVNEKRTKAIKENPYHPAHFHYDETLGKVTCPQNRQLSHSCHREAKKGIPDVDIHRCYHHDCSVRHLCCPKSPKQIEVSLYHLSLFRQQYRRKQPWSRYLLAQRKGIVEPVFGHIKQQMGWRRFTQRGMLAASTQWSMICAVYNLKKIYKQWQKTA